MPSAINPANFTTNIDNPLYTLRPGTTFILEDREGNATATIEVTHQTRVVNGVTCVVVRDTARVNGLLEELTVDWFAQDNLGNVWYFGEETAEYEPGNPIPDNTEGSWEAGIDGARPGIVMQADPQRGQVYRQEFAPGIAEDAARVLALNASVSTGYGTFTDNVLRTLDFTFLDASVTENKFYVPGVGFVLATTPDGGREELVRIIVEGRGGDDEVIGYAGGDIMRGLDGDDLVRGLGGNDSMAGGDGRDTLNGGDGGDDLNGGAGNDWLIGGDGSDSFILTGLNNGTVESDLVDGYRKIDVDVIDLPRGLRSIAGQALVGGDWRLTLAGDGDIIVLDGIVDANGNGRIVDELLIV